MSTIENMYDSTAVSYRQDYISGSTIKKALVAYLSSFPCTIQPQEPTLSESMAGSFGKTWVMFCAIADFKEGDKILVNGTDDYRVVGVEIFNFGRNPHAEVIIRDFRE